MRFHRPPFFSGRLYPEAIFRIKTTERELCLTFDDGPDPGSTLNLIEILGRKGIPAIFFCNGMAAEKYPSLMEAIRLGGHLIGNHGYKHLNGWITERKRYRQNVTIAAPFTSSKLFRPPHGRLKSGQYLDLRSDYKIMFWDVMPYDFDDHSGGQDSLLILKKMIRPGSVIALHDTISSPVHIILEEFIDYSAEKGFRFILPQL